MTKCTWLLLPTVFAFAGIGCTSFSSTSLQAAPVLDAKEYSVETLFFIGAGGASLGDLRARTGLGSGVEAGIQGGLSGSLIADARAELLGEQAIPGLPVTATVGAGAGASTAEDGDYRFAYGQATVSSKLPGFEPYVAFRCQRVSFSYNEHTFSVDAPPQELIEREREFDRLGTRVSHYFFGVRFDLGSAFLTVEASALCSTHGFADPTDSGGRYSIGDLAVGWTHKW